VTGIVDPSLGTISVPVLVSVSAPSGSVIVNIATATDSGDGAAPVSASAQVTVLGTAAVASLPPAASSFPPAPSSVPAGLASRLTTTVVVPEVHTGKPWSSRWYWAMMALVSLVGLGLLGYRRRRGLEV
jgi:hypothetical protein